MALSDIVQNMISQLGQCQDERAAKELDARFARVDEREAADLLRFARGLAPLINYYRSDNVTPDDTWEKFLPQDEAAAARLLAQRDEAMTPHLALLLTLFELYRQPQEVLNRITGRHLDFYYRRVLGLRKKDAVPDRVHVLLELKKQAAPVAIGVANEFSAGKDLTKVELAYAPTEETVINRAKVDSLRSIFVDPAQGRVLYAPQANSSDGLGGGLTGSESKWSGFGHSGLPPAQVGLAFASPVLRLAEGSRTVTATLAVDYPDSATLSALPLAAAFDVFVTGPKGWMKPGSFTLALGSGKILTLGFPLTAGEAAVVDYDAAIHGGAYAVAAPIVQLLLRTDTTAVGYADLKSLRLLRARIAVAVTGVKSLALESDSGSLDPKKAFMPFGPQPASGSIFRVGYDEAFAKKLTKIVLTVKWKDPPEDFGDWYAEYGQTVSNASFKARVEVGTTGNWTPRSQNLFDDDDARNDIAFTFTSGAAGATQPVTEGMFLEALTATGRHWAAAAGLKLLKAKPVLYTSALSKVPALTLTRRATGRTGTAAEATPGFVTLELTGKYGDFLHATYRTKYVATVLQYSKEGSGEPALLKAPYAPVIQSITMAYEAQTDDVVIAPTGTAADGLANFSNPDLQFFHVAYFGQMREHGYQRQQFDFLTDKTVPLLPAYDHEGELLIGLTNLNPGDSVSLLFQVAEGSADPDLERQDIAWSVLCDNYWMPLDEGEIALDTTNQLLTSGLIRFAIPTAATTNNTVLPGDHLWLRAAVAEKVAAVCQLIAVSANAVEARFIDRGNDPDHLLTALPEGSIGKLRSSLSAVKTVSQPYASFGGSAVESDEAFFTRASERLRHKDRCITPWDYERIVLEAFPKVHKVKCIPHAKDGSWLAPGHVMIVVVPDLRNRNAVDPLQPKVDADTLSRIETCARQRAWMQSRVDGETRIHVKNPRYQRIRLDFKVRFRAGCEFNFYRSELEQRLVEFLSPWAFDPQREISFGGRIYKSVLLDFVEEVADVDFVTDFRMYRLTGTETSGADLDETQPETPDAILVSDRSHSIGEVQDTGG